MQKINVSEILLKNNIFNMKKGDGIAYLVFYIIIPVTITAVSLVAFPENDNISAIYCYISILISALNCIYDGANRWEEQKSIRNTKLFFMLFMTSIVATYCLVVIICIMITQTTACRCDWILCVYFGTVLVSFLDIGACFVKDIELKKLVSA
ncbi:MAG: hypothetical protein IKL49_04035 [Lachnospiraceae bacterium]|nr:hypothetical protein [Lachnospiraceae bacterium]